MTPLLVNPGTIATWGLAVVAAGTAPTNALVGGAIYNSTPLTVSNTQSAALQSDANGYLKVNLAANAFGTITVTATDLSTNLAQVGGTSTVTGGVNGSLGVGGLAASGSAVAGDPVLIAGSDGTDARSIATNTSGQPVVVGPGTAGSASGGVLTVQGVASMTPLLVNPNTIATWGLTAAPTTAPTNYLSVAAIGQNAEPASLATNGQTIPLQADLTGKLITMPYANKTLFLRGAGSSTSTGTTITVLGSAGTGLYGYLTALQCGNTSATTIYVTLSDGASSVFILPAGGGTNVTFPTPLVSSSTATAITATLSGSVSTIYCNGQGYKGS
jgi:hypothetical protein